MDDINCIESLITYIIENDIDYAYENDVMMETCDYYLMNFQLDKGIRLLKQWKNFILKKNDLDIIDERKLKYANFHIENSSDNPEYYKKLSERLEMSK